MSELDLHGLPPLPPARPMTDEDWERLHAKVFGTIGAYERRRRTRTLLIAAAVLVVALIALAATWQLTRPSANSRTGFTVACASDATSAANVLVVTSNGDPRELCAAEWAKGAVAPRPDDATVGAPAVRTLPGLIRRTWSSCRALTRGRARRSGTRTSPPAYAADAPRFEQVQAALLELTSGRFVRVVHARPGRGARSDRGRRPRWLGGRTRRVVRRRRTAA